MSKISRRGKRRSKSQRIGEKGEALYKAWAVDNGLTAQKVDDDYGVDFFSQTFKPIRGGSEEITGSVIAVQVRSVEGKQRKRIKLDRSDAENALRLSIPYCLIAIDISEKKVYHRFLDEGFLIELDTFLRSPRQSLSMGLSSLKYGSDKFQADLNQVSEQGYQYRLRIIKAKRDIRSDIPGADISIIQKSDFGAAKVHLPWITQAFSFGAESQEEAARFVFQHGVLPPANHPEIQLRRSFEAVAELASGPLSLEGTFEEEKTLFVEYQGKRAVAPFCLRRIGDERAYVGESGLVLIMSEPRHLGGQWVHQLSLRLNTTNAKPMLDCTNSKDFLSKLRPGAELNEIGRDGIPISYWRNLEIVGPFIDAIYLIAEHLKIDSLHDVILADIKDEELRIGIGLLDAMLSGVEIERLLPGFIAGPGREQPYSDSNWEKTGFRIPVVFNFKDRGVVIWVTGQGSIYIAGDPPLICGFRAEIQDSWEVELRDERLPVGHNPVAWITTEWPGIPVMPSKEIFEKGLIFKGPINNPFGGELWKLRS